MDNKVSYKIISWDEFSHPEEVNQPSKTSPQMVSTSLKGLHISAQLDFDQGKFEELELIFKYLFYWPKTIFEIPSYFSRTTKRLSRESAFANFPGKYEGRRFNSSQWGRNLIFQTMINF